MANSLQKFDVVSRIFLGLAGFVLSAVLAYNEVSDKNREANQRERELFSNRGDNLVKEFKDYYVLARDAKDGDPFARSDLDLASTIAQVLAVEYKRTFYSDAIINLKSRFDSRIIVDRRIDNPIQSNAGFQAGESRTSSVPTDPNAWFAVAASYTSSPAGCQLAIEKARKLQTTLGHVELWRTKISNKYAVVVGSRSDRPTALANAQFARASGAAFDAFTQIDRSWTKVADCAA